MCVLLLICVLCFCVVYAMFHVCGCVCLPFWIPRPRPVPPQKLMVSRAKSGYYPDTLTGVSDLEPIRAVLHKHDGRIVYEHLVVLPVVGPSLCVLCVCKLMRGSGAGGERAWG